MTIKVSGPRAAERRRFCSIACTNAVINQERIVRPMRGIEANRARRAARLALPPVCAICGWDDVDACHIVAVRHGGSSDLDNMVMLCPNHHRLYDTGRITVDEVRAARSNCLPH